MKYSFKRSIAKLWAKEMNHFSKFDFKWTEVEKDIWKMIKTPKKPKKGA